MYPKNAASPERISVGAVILISDRTVQTSGVSITVVPQGGTTAAGGGTTSYEQGVVFYVPTQAETNYSSFIITAYKASCLPVSVTVVTTASSTSGKVVLSGETHTSAVIPTVTTLAGHTAQTGDCYARLGAPSGASVSADIAAAKSDTAAILVDTADIQPKIGSPAASVAADIAAVKAETAIILSDTNDIQTRVPAALVGGRMDSNLSAISNSTTTMAAFNRAVKGNVIGTVGVGSTTTSIVSSALTPAGTAADQFKGRYIVFADDTTTAALRGQASDITANTASATPTFTVTAMTTAAASGDTFSIT